MTTGARFIFFFLLMISSAELSAQTASARLDRTLSLVNNSPSVNIEFSIEGNGTTSTGVITMAANKFHLRDNNGRYETWFDGKTQWTWSGMTNEVSVIEPTQDELIDINPFYIVNTAKANYDISVGGEDMTRTILNLVPKSKNNSVAKVIIILSKSTGYPEKMQIYENLNSTPVNIEIKKITTGNKMDDKFFKFDASSTPGVEINDLR